MTWQLIREKFSECGEVKFAEMTAPDTAIVRFLKEWDAERAISILLLATRQTGALYTLPTRHFRVDLPGRFTSRLGPSWHWEVEPLSRPSGTCSKWEEFATE